MKLENKVAVVTGAGSGIGRATALLFAREGARVVVAEVRAEDGQETVGLIGDAGGVASFVQTDVSRAAEVAAMVQHAVQTFGGLNILHNNAGIFPRGVAADEMTEEYWNRVLSVNLTGVWLGCKYAIPALIAAGGGAIVNTASLAGLRGRAYNAAYVASKAGVIGLTRSLAIELSPHRIRVNCICPGGTDTPMTRPPNRTAEQLAASRPAIVAHLPLQRMAEPEEMAAAVLYLASDDASYVNGHALVVDGGEYAGTMQGLRR